MALAEEEWRRCLLQGREVWYLPRKRMGMDLGSSGCG